MLLVILFQLHADSTGSEECSLFSLSTRISKGKLLNPAEPDSLKL